MPSAVLALICLRATFAAEGAQPAQAPRRDEWQYLQRYFTVDGFAESTPADGTGFDAAGRAFAAGFLPRGEKLTVRSSRYGAVEFPNPPTDGDRPNMVPCQGQEIPVSTKRIFNVLFSLGAAHHGAQFGWIEFRFEDGSKGLGPFGFSDWHEDPILGEETAFSIPVRTSDQNTSANAPRLWLQRTPIPAAKRVVSIRLPSIPNAKIVGLTLGWREGVNPIEPRLASPPDPGPVAIFGEPGFPHYFVRGDLQSDRIALAFKEAKISAAILGLEHLKDPAILNPKAYPVLVNPYGNTFPADAEENLRAYRRSGGSMVHVGVPFTQPVHRTPYGSWINRGHTNDYLTHQGERAMGSGGFVAFQTPQDLVAQPPLVAWGLGEVAWTQHILHGHDVQSRQSYIPQCLQRQTLPTEDEVVPLLNLKSADLHPFAALIRHRACAFDGCTDLWLGHVCVGLEPLDAPLDATVQLILRGAASILREKGIISEETWKEVTRPVPEMLRAPEVIEPVLPDAGGSWHLPDGPPTGRKVLCLPIAGLLDSERVLFASAQGLINRSGADVSAYLVDSPTAERRLQWCQSEGLVDEISRAGPREILERVGHRRAVVVDPDLRGSLNLAVMISAAEGVLVAHPENVEAYGLEVAADLRGLFQSQAECIDWAVENLRPRLESRCLALVQPDARMYGIMDYLIARRVFTFWLSWGNEGLLRGAGWTEEYAAAAKLLARSPVATPVLAAPEAAGGDSGVVFLSRFGKYKIGVEGLANLSFTATLRAQERPAAKQTKPPSELDGAKAGPRLSLHKVYLACVSSAFSRLEAFPRLAEETGPREASPSPCGVLLPPAAFDLFPARAAKLVASLGAGPCLGSAGLGEVDAGAFGGAFRSSQERVQRLYWELTDRSLKDLGHRFLVLPRWQAVGGADIAFPAGAVKSAAVILPTFRTDAVTQALEGAYVAEGKPVIHALSSDLAPLQPAAFSSGPFAKARPLFSWCLVPGGPTGALAPEVALVSPVELAALAREYLMKVAPEKVTLIPQGSVWRYDDSGNDRGIAWQALDYDDSHWASGPAELGYGDATEGIPETTVIGFGAAASKKNPCVYFRKTFEVASPEDLRSLALEVIRDDGCVAHLNGREAARSNMPEGEVSFDTLALRAVAGEDEHRWQHFDLKPTLLRKGTNVLAVEIHQSGVTSSDLSFDLRLVSFKEKKALEDQPKESGWQPEEPKEPAKSKDTQSGMETEKAKASEPLGRQPESRPVDSPQAVERKL